MRNQTISAPVRPGDATEQALSVLRGAIQDGRFAPGQRLIEADLMQTFTVTRGPLREALRRLASEGMVVIVPNRGAMVRVFNRQEMIDLFRIREVIEGLAARQAAEAMVDEKCRIKFEAALVKMDRARSVSAVPFSKENVIFHELVLTYARNKQLTGLMRQLQLPLVRFQIRASIDDAYREASRREHEAVVQAVSKGNATLAESLMRKHLRQAADRVIARL